MDAHYIEENYRIGEEIEDTKSLGYLIADNCYFYTSYQLIKMADHLGRLILLYIVIRCFFKCEYFLCYDNVL